MNLRDLGKLVGRAIRKPAPIARELCGNYYSPYYSLFYYLTHELKRGLVVELGVEKGRGSACLAAGSQGVTVVGVDHTRRPEVAEVLARFPNFAFLEQPSLPVPDAIQARGEKIKMLHIDTEHSYATAQSEFRAYQPLLEQGAVVCFDDLHACNDGVLQFVLTLPYPKLLDDRLHPITGFGVVLYESGLV